jgi:hypothetical protein
VAVAASLLGRGLLNRQCGGRPPGRATLARSAGLLALPAGEWGVNGQLSRVNGQRSMGETAVSPIINCQFWVGMGRGKVGRITAV